MTIGWIFPLAVAYFAGAAAGIAMMETRISRKHSRRLKLLRLRMIRERHHRTLETCYRGEPGEITTVGFGTVRALSPVGSLNSDTWK